MTPAGFHHLAIQVADLPRAEAFYCGLLGLRVLKRWPWSPEALAAGRTGERSLWVAVGAREDDGFLALEACAPPGNSSETLSQRGFKDETPGLHLLSLRIPAHERPLWESRLAAAGIEIVHRSQFTLYVRDPEGNRVGLSHWPDVGPGAAP